MNNNVDLNLYRTFYVVAKYKNFTKASQELYISQPAVTQAIKKLEEQLNVELFKRTSNGIVLTKAGDVVYSYAERLNDLALGNQNMVERAKEESFEQINIGVPTHIGTFYLVNYLKEFNDEYPNIKFNIVNSRSDDMIKMLIRRELDVVIDTDMIEYDDNLIITKQISNLNGCFLCNERFKNISESGSISVKQLTECPLILPGKNTANRKSIDAIFKKKNIILHPLIEANSSSISKGIISNGIGIGWMIKEFVEDDINNGSLFEIKVDIDNVKIPISIAYNKKFNPDIVKKFINILN